MEVATLGAGCFWCVEAIYRSLKGVHKVTPGYSGGHIANPTYEEVSTGTTGHAEVCRIEYDPKVLPYAKLLEVYFTIHDPTTLNRQGSDVGPQYRSVIFYHSEEQRRIAEHMKEQLNASGRFSRPLVTDIVAFTEFYEAEEYHKDYYSRHTGQPYCQIVIRPKLSKVNEVFKEFILDE